MKTKISFNTPFSTGEEYKFVSQSIKDNLLAGKGHFGKLCEDKLESLYPGSKCLLTHSCSGALEIAARILSLKAQDEIIAPSYTFVTSISSFLCNGVVIKFADINPLTHCIDPKKIIELITNRTKAIVVVHYGGACPEIYNIKKIAKDNNLILIEDAAQSISTSVNGKPLGTFGDIATLSFHQTKNIQCGEGGAIIINKESFYRKANIIRDKGTNRIDFENNMVDKYTWVDLGGSYTIGELNSAFLYSQLLSIKQIISSRLSIWESYFYAFSNDSIVRKYVPTHYTNLEHNGHLFYLLMESEEQRNQLIKWGEKSGICYTFHYIPLHSSPYILSLNYKPTELPISDQLSKTILRLPLWIGVDYKRVIINIKDFFHDIS